MNALRLIRAIWIIGALAFILPAWREPFFRVRMLPLAAGTAWMQGEFKPDAVFPTTVRGALPENIGTAGSWIGGDDWQGRVETAWFTPPVGSVRVCVAGYPREPGCTLQIEFRHRDGSVSRVAAERGNPGERWAAWDFYVPSHGKPATALRLVADDRSSAPAGWLAFSQPFVPVSALAASLFEGAQVLATLALALTLIWLPGLFAARFARTAESRLALTLSAGSIILVVLGGLLWGLSPWVRPTTLGPLLAGAVWAVVGTGLWIRRFLPAPGPSHDRVLALAALCMLAVTAKATYSGGPHGELFGGTIGRTLAVGNREDVRVAFATAQMIHRQLPPTSLEAERYFTPWTFFSRGPLAGLVAAPIVFATGGQPPVRHYDWQDWEPFDPTGYAAYRIAMHALAGLIIFAFFAVLAALIGDAWALIGAGLLALCPFIMHELSFTWPKLAATSWLLVSFLFAHQRRALGGGVALAIAYLFHPMALLWTPWLALWAAGRAGDSWRLRSAGGVRFGFGAALLVLPWTAGALLPHHLSSTTLAGQGGWLRYFFLADGLPATLQSWLHTRWLNFSNTFLPFWLDAVNKSHTDLNSRNHPVGSLVKFAFSWWTTLPLGMGIAVWAGCVVALFRAARKLGAAVVLLVFAPAAFLTIYWGGAASGLMRECGHPLLVAIIGVVVFWLARNPGRLTALTTHRAVPWLQLPETLLMLWLTTLANPEPPELHLKSLDPVWFAVNIAALAAAAHLLARARSILPSSGAPASS